jgi:pimeloyl-ACP methyl ester carboxylesterase
MFCKSKKESDHPMELKPKNYSDTVKSSEAKKAYKTSEDRMKENLRYFLKEEVPLRAEQCRQGEGEKQSTIRNSSLSDWAVQAYDKASRMVSFLWEKKSAIGIGAMLAFARLGVEGRPLGRSNATDLSPVEWKGFNNFSHSTAFEPPAHWRKLQESDTKSTVTVSRQSVKDTSNPPQIANSPMEIPKIDHAARAHLEKLGGNPDQLVRETEMHTIKEKQQRTSLEKKKGQIASSIRRALIDKTASDELARRMLVAHQRRELSTNTQNTQSIVFVHGFYTPGGSVPKGSSNGQDCALYWGPAMDMFSSLGWKGDYRTIKYYKGDTNNINGAAEGRYSSDLHHSLYSAACASWSPGFEGTNDESLDHLSCLFAQYLYYNFGQSNSKVALVGHSMGGIIIRNTLARVQTDGGQGIFPTNVGRVTDAITLNTPHTGVISGAESLACGGCQQVTDMADNGALMSYLSRSGRNPQASSITTDWTVIGSDCDDVIAGAELGNTGVLNAVYMNAKHAVMYHSPCYDHMGTLKDKDHVNHNAQQYYCDTTDPNNNPCGLDTSSSNWVNRKNGPHSLLEVYTELTRDAS